jgi:hypothetical protein
MNAVAQTTRAEDPLSDDELTRLDAYWRAANYLSVGQIYLLDNPRERSNQEDAVTEIQRDGTINGCSAWRRTKTAMPHVERRNVGQLDGRHDVLERRLLDARLRSAVRCIIDQRANDVRRHRARRRASEGRRTVGTSPMEMRRSASRRLSVIGRVALRGVPHVIVHRGAIARRTICVDRSTAK